MPSEKRKAKRQQYLNAAKKSKKYANGMVLKEDMRGFLLTCNNREKETVREGYNLLNEYADKIFGPEMKESNLDDDDEEEDIDAALDKEKASLKAANEKPKTERRFQQVESGANNCIFIKTAIDAPGKLVEEIVNDLNETKVQKCRFILRMLPILGTCKAYEKNIEEHSILLFFRPSKLTFDRECYDFTNQMRNSTLAKSIERLKSNTASNRATADNEFDVIDDHEYNTDKSAA